MSDMSSEANENNHNKKNLPSKAKMQQELNQIK